MKKDQLWITVSVSHEQMACHRKIGLVKLVQPDQFWMQKLVCPDQIKSTKTGLAGPFLVTKIGWTWSGHGFLNILAFRVLRIDYLVREEPWGYSYKYICRDVATYGFMRPLLLIDQYLAESQRSIYSNRAVSSLFFVVKAYLFLYPPGYIFKTIQ